MPNQYLGTEAMVTTGTVVTAYTAPVCGKSTPVTNVNAV